MDVFSAISDPVRRGLLGQLGRSGPARVVDLTAGHDISRPAISRHLRVLGEAGLVTAIDHGRERHYELVAEPLQEVISWVGTLTEARPPVGEHHLDALDLEVRRTVRDHGEVDRGSRPGGPHTGADIRTTSRTTAGESA